MAESTLSIQWKEIQARVGLFIGWGRGALYQDLAWSAQQQFELDGFVASGLRRFYFPEPLPGEEVPHKWSFLRPTATLDLPSGTSTVPMPDDYGGYEGQLTVNTSGQASQPWYIEWVGEPLIRERFSQYPQMIGPPMMAAPLPIKGTSATAGQRFELRVFPTSDQDYKLQVRYYICPDYLSTPFPYAYGGVQHAETILEACMSVAEERLFDMLKGSGPHSIAFGERMKASVAADRTMQEQRIGYNRDRSDERDVGGWGNPHYWAPAATYNGQSFN